MGGRGSRTVSALDLDVLVNAGMRLYQTVVDASEESWDAILAVNVKVQYDTVTFDEFDGGHIAG